MRSKDTGPGFGIYGCFWRRFNIQDWDSAGCRRVISGITGVGFSTQRWGGCDFSRGVGVDARLNFMPLQITGSTGMATWHSTLATQYTTRTRYHRHKLATFKLKITRANINNIHYKPTVVLGHIAGRDCFISWK